MKNGKATAPAPKGGFKPKQASPPKTTAKPPKKGKKK